MLVATDPLFVAGAAEQELFKQQAHLLVTPAQGSDVERKLLDAASSGWLDLQLNLQRIKPSTLASTLLPTVLEFGDRCVPRLVMQRPCLLGVSVYPLCCCVPEKVVNLKTQMYLTLPCCSQFLVADHRKRAAVAWEEGQPSSAWLQQLWDLLVEHPDLRPLEGWPLLPVAGPLLARLHPASQVPQWPGLGEFACPLTSSFVVRCTHCPAGSKAQGKLATVINGLSETASDALAAGCQGGQLG